MELQIHENFFFRFLLLFSGLPAPIATTLTSQNYMTIPSEDRQGKQVFCKIQ